MPLLSVAKSVSQLLLFVSLQDIVEKFIYLSKFNNVDFTYDSMLLFSIATMHAHSTSCNPKHGLWRPGLGILYLCWKVKGHSRQVASTMVSIIIIIYGEPYALLAWRVLLC